MSASLRLCATLALLGIAGLSGCTPPPSAPPPAPVAVAPPPPPANHPLMAEKPDFLRLPNLPPGETPVRVGIILPLNSGAQGARALAGTMLKAAELALYDSKNRDIVLMTADEGGSPDAAAAAARKLLDQGAEIILGPLFGPSVAAVAPVARDRGVPVIAFSTERRVAGQGVYLLSFLAQAEVNRVVGYAAQQGHRNFAALLPATPYGDVVADAFSNAVKTAGGSSVDVERFQPDPGAVMAPAAAAAKSNADAILIAQGGNVLSAIGPSLAFNGLDTTKVKLLGTGLWDDAATTREGTLSGGWFAAPAPDAADAFDAHYRETFGATPPQLASLAYDAVSLVALLSGGQPYHRFTPAALTDPNGFSGVDGIFRFNADGTSERGLAVLEVQPDGFHVVSPAPKTFQNANF